MKKYDAIIIGGGHNGLTAAAYLAKAGQKVLVLERRVVLGGAAATEEVFPGYRIDTGAHDAGLFLPEIVNDFNLSEYGLEFVEAPAAVFVPVKRGRAGLTLWQDPEKSQPEIARLSKADAEVFPEFVEFVSKVSGILASTFTLTPPEVVDNKLHGGFDWLKPALALRRLGKHDMMEMLRILPLSVTEFLDEWFESDALKGAIGAAGVIGTMLGPMAAGTTFNLLYQYSGAPNGGFKSSRLVRGGLGKLSEALAAAAKDHGAQIRTGVDVARIDLENGRAVGVTTSDGEQILAKRVVSNADPRRTFFELAGAPNLGPEFNRKVRNIRYRGSTAKLNLILSGLPDFGQAAREQLSGHIVICPSLEYLERAYDDAKYGTFSRQPYLDIVIPTIMDDSRTPSEKHIMSVTMQYAPFHLRDSDWNDERESLRNQIMTTLVEYAPGLTDLVEETHIVSPLQWQSEYGLTEGSIFHGQMALDQLFLMRPVSGWARYRTPIENLYLCGAGTHPGGGVTGAPGLNAARALLQSLKVKT